jgi:F-type H+-transporting ATPase subunit a
MFVGLVLILLFSRLAARIERGMPPKGKFWNLLEVFLVFIRDQIARPILGSHDHGHESGHGSDGEHEHGDAAHAHAAHDHGGHSHEHAAHAADPAIRFLPLLWTIFFFVLGCNLMGMLPWAGAPTATLAVTLALACITLVTVIGAGMMQFGVAGYFLNQIPPIAVGRPSNPLLWVVAVVFELLLKVMILIIEVGGMLIKNGVLAVRLLANMVAGHLVILGIMGLAFGAEAAIKFSGAPGWQWGATALIAIVASAAFNVLELFVAFLQAYIITFLSALFIGAAIHKH